MAPLQQTLQEYHNDVLKAMGHALGGGGGRKAELVRDLAKAVRMGQYVERVVADLTPPERRLLGLLQVAGGEAHSNALKSRLLREKVVKPTPKGKQTWTQVGYIHVYEANPNYRAEPNFEDLVARLTRQGLVLSRKPLPHRKLIQWTPGEEIFIPKTILSRLPQFAQPEAVVEAKEPAQVLAGSSRAFQRDLGRYWRYIRSTGELRLTAQGYVYKADLKKINERLSVAGDLGVGKGEADNKRMYFIRRLLRDLEVVEGAFGTNMHPVLETSFWGLSPGDRVKRSFEAWRDGGGWNELLHLPIKARGYRHSYSAPARLKRIRKTILNHVKNTAKREWISLDRLTERIQLADYGFLFPKRQVGTYAHYQSYYYPSRLTPYYEANNELGISFEDVKNEADGWEKVEANLIAHIVAGPLFWMGLVDLGYDKGVQPDPMNPPRPTAFRLTNLGAWALGLDKAVEIQEEGGRIVVQPNFQILAMEPISDEALITLDHFADAEGGGDRVMSYKLTRQTVYQGQQQGWDTPRIISYLEKASGTPLPGNVRRSLEEWQTLHERIVFRCGQTLAQAADAEVLDQLLQDAGTRRALSQRVTKTVTLSPQKVSQVADALRKCGWLPLVTPAGEQKVPAILQADEEGHLRFVHAAPNIYALGRVAPFAEMVDGGTYRITPQAVRQALKRKKTTVKSILEALRSVHVGEVPEKLVFNIKAWGTYYGNARIDTLTLIQFRSQTALRELVADPDLSPYLKPFKAGPRPLAIVDREHIDTLQRLLADRGVKVEWGLR